MESRIPVPTDNIYKFYALFGLLLAVFSIGGIIYVNKATNELIFSTAVEYDELKQIQQPNGAQAAKFTWLQRELEIARGDKEAFIATLSFFFVGALLLIGYGFWKWHRYLQPMQDELLQLQIKKLRRELSDGRRTTPRK